MAFDNAPTVLKYRMHDTDSGSSRVQVALLTERINYLTDHFRAHKRTTTAAVVSSRWWVDAAGF